MSFENTNISLCMSTIGYFDYNYYALFFFKQTYNLLKKQYVLNQSTKISKLEEESR